MIIVGMSRPRKTKIGSELIKLHQGTSASHVYVKFYSKRYDLWLVYEAAYGEVGFMELSNWEKINESLYEKSIDCTEEQLNKVVKWCIKKCRTKYGFLTVLGVALDADFLIEDGAKSFICTELSYEIMKMIGIDMIHMKYSLKAFENWIKDGNN
jgi:hypothetical protein